MLHFATVTEQGLISIEAAAAEFGIHRTTLFRYVAEGRLVRHRLLGDRKTYVSRPDVLRLVDSPAVIRCLELVYEGFAKTGEWPSASAIQRQLARARDDFDFLAALEGLPPELGWRSRDSEDRAQLALRGVARCEHSAADVNAFVAVVRACYDRYIGDDDDLSVNSEEFRQSLGLNNLALARLYKLVQTESGFWNGLSGFLDGGWSLTINPDRIRHFGAIETFADYLGAKERALQPSAGAFAGMFVQEEESDVAPTSDWHPVVAAAVGDLLNSNPTAAVLAAATAFERLLADRADGDRMAGRAAASRFFDMAQRASPPDPRRVEALKSIAIGAFGAFRNPAAHGQMEFEAFYAREAVTLFSLLAREVEALPMPARANDAASTA